MSPIPPIKGFIPVSLSDWPGRITAVLFLPGCNLRCPYCHNSVLAHHPDRLESVSLEDALAEIRRRPGWIDGVTITGGEPTGQPGLKELLHRIHRLKLATKLDTNGTRPEVLRSLLAENLLDGVSLDLKAPLRPEPYRRVTGTRPPLDEIRRSLELLLTSSVELEVRTTVVPGWLTEDDLVEIGRLAAGAHRFTLQRYRPPDPVPPVLEGIQEEDQSAFEDLRRRVTEGVS